MAVGRALVAGVSTEKVGRLLAHFTGAVRCAGWAFELKPTLGVYLDLVIISASFGCGRPWAPAGLGAAGAAGPHEHCKEWARQGGRRDEGGAVRASVESGEPCQQPRCCCDSTKVQLTRQQQLHKHAACACPPPKRIPSLASIAVAGHACVWVRRAQQ